MKNFISKVLPLAKTFSSRRREEGYFTGKIYPDNTCTIGYVAKKEATREDREYEKEEEQQWDAYYRTRYYYGKKETVEERFFDRGILPNRFIEGSESSQKSKTYGKKGITAYGKKVVSNGALLLQKKYGKRRLGFGTATLPTVSKEATRFLLRNWGDIVRQFFQSIKRIVERRGNQFNYVSCTEIQERRFSRTKLAYPHLHWVYESRRSVCGEWYVSANEYRKTWKRVVLNFLRKGGFLSVSDNLDFEASMDCQSIRKTASGYLGKYLSKGCGVVKRMQEEGYEEFPRQWWSASKSVKKMFKDSIVHLSPRVATAIFYQFDNLLDAGVIIEGSYCYITLGDKEVAIGLSFTIDRSYLPLLDAL